MDVFYGDLQALWDVSITIDEGKIVTLVGSNGAGKSSVLRGYAWIECLLTSELNRAFAWFPKGEGYSLR
jgi:branched-chain amino acid transport system ATP-binding protein